MRRAIVLLIALVCIAPAAAQTALLGFEAFRFGMARGALGPGWHPSLDSSAMFGDAEVRIGGVEFDPTLEFGPFGHDGLTRILLHAPITVAAVTDCAPSFVPVLQELTRAYGPFAEPPFSTDRGISPAQTIAIAGEQTLVVYELEPAPDSSRLVMSIARWRGPGDRGFVEAASYANQRGQSVSCELRLTMTPEAPARPSPALAEGYAPNAEEFAATPTLTQIRWAQRPTAQELMGAFPERALDRGVTEGAARLDCIADASGAMRCAVISETPSGWGFGAAALTLGYNMRVDFGGEAPPRRLQFTLRWSMGEE